MEKKLQLKSLLFEFLRYCVVGGLAFLVDFGLLVLFKEVVLPELGGWRLYIATAIGFIGGLIFNYIFSLIFVFNSAKHSKGADFAPPPDVTLFLSRGIPSPC